jgi:hypothetical protein
MMAFISTFTACPAGSTSWSLMFLCKLPTTRASAGSSTHHMDMGACSDRRSNCFKSNRWM